MKGIIKTLLSAGFFVISVVVLLMLFNSFMTIAVAQANHALDANGIGTSATGTGMSVSKAVGETGVNIDIAQTAGGLIVQTKDGSMKLTKNGIEMPDF